MWRNNHTHSKYEKLYAKSVNIALTSNKTHDDSKTSVTVHNKTNEKTQKRRLSEYNRFIRDNSSNVTGPDRLKKLSKMWKLQKSGKKSISSTDSSSDESGKKTRQQNTDQRTK